MHGNGYITTSSPILTPNLKFPLTVSYSTTNLVALTPIYNIYECIQHKTAFVIQSFWNFRANGGVGESSLTKPSIGTSVADFTCFETLCMQIRSRVLFLDLWMQKGHYGSHREFINFTTANFPLNHIQPKFTSRKESIAPILVMIGRRSTKLRRVEFCLSP